MSTEASTLLSTMTTTTVRVSKQTRDSLAKIANARGVSTAELIGELATRAEQDLLLARMNAHYGAARDDPDGWAEIVAEREAWERTLLDGLAGERDQAS